MTRAAYALTAMFLFGCQGDLTESVDSTVCASGTRWIGGNEESPNMNPGQACITCHSRGEGPSFGIAGTVYDASKEPNNCYGAVGATVEITDAAGKVTTFDLVDSGSFYTRAGFTPPYTAKVIRNGVESKMLTPQTNGDCNSCHTAEGANGAPGRIVAL